MPQLELTKVRVRSLDVFRNEVTWESSGYEDPLDYTMQVLRSESPEGPFTPISPEFVDRWVFVDATVPRGDSFRRLYYRIESKRKLDGATFTTPSTAQEPEPDLIASYIRINEYTLFTQALGRKVWIFKARTFGPRCPSCWDKYGQQRTRSNCQQCYNTGFLHGYHAPMEAWMQIDPAGQAPELTPQQKQQLRRTGARMPFYPRITPEDVVVEGENIRWKVQSVTQTERLRAVCRQELQLIEIAKSDVEYKLPINIDTALRDMLISPVRMFSNATTLTEARETDIPDVFAAYTTYPRDPTR